ncbi:ROK family protein [Patescibacteria group bacterium]|nr:ROK family protein [Patescibacteria group bacterium]MBU4023240.1 ROK family protein [Patescibacteria group bacterium]MBU4078521.1 ROK family protein [Patescibacteria group bacterium]
MKKDLVIAIDLGATNLRAGIISKNGKILKCFKIKTPKTSEAEILNNIIVLVNALLENFKKQNIKAITVAAGSPVSQDELIAPPNMPFKKIAIRKPLEKYFKLPVILNNDCIAAVWGEKHFGAGKKFKNLVYITISSGIGAGAIVDNHLLSGHSNNAAEIGHFTIDTKYNLLCGCKKGHGHWEAMCSGNNLPRFFKAWLKENRIKNKYLIRKSADIFALADKKDKIILKFLKEVGQLNGHGISNAIVAYDPELITLGGGVVLNNKKHILPYLKKNVDKYLKTPKIITTPLKEDIVLLGAAALVFYPKN